MIAVLILGVTPGLIAGLSAFPLLFWFILWRKFR